MNRWSSTLACALLATLAMIASTAKALQWIDTKTGQTVASFPVITDPNGPPGNKTDWVKPAPGDPARAYDPRTGRNFTKVLCPPKKPDEKPNTPLKPVEQTSPAPALKLDPTDQRILDVHNAERARFGYQPLKWNQVLESTATAYANRLAQIGRMVHAPREGRGTERENVNQGIIGWNPDQMLDNWLKEKRNFIPGTFPNVSRTGNWSDAGHYSQMIWPTTTDIGCGMAAGSGFQWLVCRYDPGGNKDGKPVGQPVLAGNVGSTGKAVEQPKPVRYQWIDVKTGKPVVDRPVVTANGKTYYLQADIGDPNRAFDPETGRNFARNERGDWIDTKTGKIVTSRPVVTANGKTYYLQANIGDPNHAFDPNTGRNFAKVPIPPN